MKSTYKPGNKKGKSPKNPNKVKIKAESGFNKKKLANKKPKKPKKPQPAPDWDAGKPNKGKGQPKNPGGKVPGPGDDNFNMGENLGLGHKKLRGKKLKYKGTRKRRKIQHQKLSRGNIRQGHSNTPEQLRRAARSRIRDYQ